MVRVLTTILLMLTCAAVVRPQDGADEAEVLRGEVMGVVRDRGVRFARRPVLWPAGLLDRDVELTRALDGRTLLEEGILVDEKGGGVANCVLWLPDFELAGDKDAVMTLMVRDFAFTPRVQVLRPGAPLDVVNEDPLAHVFEVRGEGGTVLGEFEVAAGAQVRVEAVDGAARAVVEKRLPFMRAALVDVDGHPSVITGADGRFKFSGLPLGEVNVRGWHEVLGRVEKKFVVKPEAEAKDVEVTRRAFRYPVSSRAPFSTRGGTVLRIEGVPVGRGEVDDVVAFYRQRYAEFVMPDAVLTEYAIRRVVIPVAATWAHFRLGTPEIDGRADEVVAKLKERTAPEDIPGLVPGVHHAFVRRKSRRDLDPSVGLRAFSLEVPGMVGPFHTANGVHVLVVAEIADDETPPLRSFHHLHVPYAVGTIEEHTDLVRRLAQRARVEVLDPKIERHVPERNRR